jgi:hypothetical protein
MTMAENRGGYRKPENPAPVSGPGKLSQRTDGGPADTRQAQRRVTGMGYGENKDLNEVQAMAPLAAAPAAPSIPSVMPAPQTPVPLTEATQRPNEPLTAGLPFGPGVGSEMLNLPNQGIAPDDRQRALLVLGVLQDSISAGTATQGTINLMRQLRSELL